MEMSEWKSQGVHGVDGNYIPDLNLTEGFQIWSEEEIKKNCEYAGLDYQDTVFSPGDLRLSNILVDENNNFVGFRRFNNAGFAPQNWVQATLLTPAAREEAGIHVRDAPCSRDPSVLLMWPNILSD